jgi:hypothetical protein
MTFKKETIQNLPSAILAHSAYYTVVDKTKTDQIKYKKEKAKNNRKETVQTE